MKRTTLCIAAMLAVGSVGIAYAAPDLVTNGNFSLTSPTPSHALQVGNHYTAGNFVTDWAATGYTIWYPSEDSAVNGCGETQYHSGSGGNCSTLNVVNQLVPGRGSTFVALDGVDNDLQGSIWQTINGLSVGSAYTVSFWWGTTQEAQANSHTNSHDEFLTVSLGSTFHDTGTVATTWDTFDGWFHTTMSFTADNSSDLLKFLANGLPSDGPPMILLTNVSVTRDVPEPPELALFGLGLLGMGFLTVLARRRALRRSNVA